MSRLTLMMTGRWLLLQLGPVWIVIDGASTGDAIVRSIVEFTELLLLGRVPRFLGVTRMRLGSLIKYSLIVFPFLFSVLPSSHSSECAFMSPPMIVSLLAQGYPMDIL